jgi:hypothetical protein
MAFDADGRTYPYFDLEIMSTVIRHDGDWMVSVTAMIFNDRVMLTHRSEYPNMATAGFCYDKGGAAALAATVWNPEEGAAPVGYKKCAFDARGLVGSDV